MLVSLTGGIAAPALFLVGAATSVGAKMGLDAWLDARAAGAIRVRPLLVSPAPATAEGAPRARRRAAHRGVHPFREGRDVGARVRPWTGGVAPRARARRPPRRPSGPSRARSGRSARHGEACVAAIEPTSRALALKDEVAARLAEVEARRLAPDSPEARALPDKLDEAQRLLEEGRAHMADCDARLAALAVAFGG